MIANAVIAAVQLRDAGRRHHEAQPFVERLGARVAGIDVEREETDRPRIRLRDDHGIDMPDNPARWDDLKAMGFEPPAKLSRGSHPSLPHERLPSFIADLRAATPSAAAELITANQHRIEERISIRILLDCSDGP